MKTLFALVFCISVILLVYLSGALNKTKPELKAIQDFSLYDRIDCTQDCQDHNIIGQVKKGQNLVVLSQIKGKTKIVLRLESESTAGWIAFDESLMQKIVENPEVHDN